MTTPHPEPKRRWFQFSLRTLLVLTTLCAVTCSWFAVKMRQKHRERLAVTGLLRAGGRVLYDSEYRWDDPRPKQPGPAWLRRILGDDFFSVVEGVVMYDIELGDVEWSCVRNLTSLQRLQLVNCQVTDAELIHLTGLGKLRQLGLSGNPITDMGVYRLTELRSLRTVDLSHTQVTDRGLEHLENLPHLRNLLIEDARVTVAGVERLQKTLPNCRVSIMGDIDVIEIEESTFDVRLH